MIHSDFSIGVEFTTATGLWRCTDVGSRTVVAIKLDEGKDPSWFDGPPYAVVEHVFDLDDLRGCQLQHSNTAIIAGREVNVATSQEVRASVEKLTAQYANALENLKNR